MRDHLMREERMREERTGDGGFAPGQPVGTVVLDRGGNAERYSVTEVPADGSALVRQASRTVLDDVDPGAVTVDLRRASDLVSAAYIGAAGTVVRADLSDCLTDLSRLCRDYTTAAAAFDDGCGEVLRNLVRCFRGLLSGDEAAAMAHLVRCARPARAMADTSGTLAARFRDLHSRTEAVRSRTLVAVAVRNDDKVELERLRDGLRASLGRQERTRRDLDGGVGELGEAGDAPTGADGPRPARAIVGAVTGVLGRGPGGYSALMRATARGTGTGNGHATVLRTKAELEKECRAANADLARLVERIGAGDTRAVATSTLAALDAASWTLAHIVVSLDRTARFWTTFQLACERLERGEPGEVVRAAVRSAEPARRIAEYDDPAVKEVVVEHLASWRALQLACGSQGKAAEGIWRDIGGRLRSEPGIGEAGAHLSELRAGLLDSITASGGQSDAARRSAR